MEKREGFAKFFAFTDDNQVYQFSVLLEDNIIYCEQLGDKSFRKIHLEPDFKVMTEDMETLSCSDLTDKKINGKGLISGVIISKLLLVHCVDKGMLSYTKESAKLFGLDPNFAIENHYVEANMGKKRVLAHKQTK